MPLTARHTRRARRARAARCGTGPSGECAAVPGRTMPKFVVVERDFGAVAQKMAALGPLLDEAGHDHEGGHRSMSARGGQAARDQWRGARRRRRRPPAAGPGHARVRSDPHSVGDHQRPARGRRLRGAGTPDRAAPGGPGRGARGQAHPLRRHPGPAGASDHQPGVVGQRARWPALLAVHHQRRAAQALAHPDRPAAPVRGPRLDARAGGVDAGVPATAGHAPTLRRARADLDR